MSTSRAFANRRVHAAVAGALTLVLSGVTAADVHTGHGSAATQAEEGTPAAPATYTRSLAEYAVPSVTLVRDDGRKVVLSDELNDGRPVVLNFIYTTCSGICPLASHVFSELQHELGSDSHRVHLVSISVDPEEDTPARLRAYAHKFAAGPGWQHYTGTVEASVAVQRAFNVYRGDKMGHTPVTLVRTAPDAPWVRFDGFATADTLRNELHSATALTAATSAARP